MEIDPEIDPVMALRAALIEICESPQRRLGEANTVVVLSAATMSRLFLVLDATGGVEIEH